MVTQMPRYFSSVATNGDTKFHLSGEFSIQATKRHDFPNFICDYSVDTSVFITHHGIEYKENLPIGKMPNTICVYGSRLIVFKSRIAGHYKSNADIYMGYNKVAGQDPMTWDKIMSRELYSSIDFSSPDAFFNSLSIILF